jgi:hypothetical protein
MSLADRVAGRLADVLSGWAREREADRDTARESDEVATPPHDA